MVLPCDPRPVALQHTTSEEIQALDKLLNVREMIWTIACSTKIKISIDTTSPTSFGPEIIMRLNQTNTYTASSTSVYRGHTVAQLKLGEVLTQSPPDRAAIEEATRKQHDCKRWHDE